MTEERVRASIDYGLYTWHGLALVADAARRVGFNRDLFKVKTTSGKSLLQVSTYYEPYLTKKRTSPHDEYAAHAVDFDQTLSEYRAASEVALRNNPKSKVLQRIVNYGGPTTRGANYDVHITGYNGLTGGVLAPSGATLGDRTRTGRASRTAAASPAPAPRAPARLDSEA